MSDKTVNHPVSERKDAAENRARILAAAITLFDQYGVEKTSMNQIATAAKVGVGTLYRRFQNKSDLCWALIHDNIKKLFEDIDNYLTTNHSDKTAEQLKHVLFLFIQFRERKAQLLTGVEGTPKINSLEVKLNGPIFGRLHDILVPLLDDLYGPTAKVDAVFCADLLITALSHEYYTFQRSVRKYSPEQIAEQLYNLLIINNI